MALLGFDAIGRLALGQISQPAPAATTLVEFDLFTQPSKKPSNFVQPDKFKFQDFVNAPRVITETFFSPFDPGRHAPNYARDWIAFSGNEQIEDFPRFGIDFTPFSAGRAAKLWTIFGQQPQWWTQYFGQVAPQKLGGDRHDGDWIPKRHHWPRRHPSVYTQEYYDQLQKKIERTEEEEQLLEEIAQVVPNLLIPINRLIPGLMLPSLTQLPPFRPVPTLTTNPPPFQMATPEEMAADDEMIIRMLLEE